METIADSELAPPLQFHNLLKEWNAERDQFAAKHKSLDLVTLDKYKQKFEKLKQTFKTHPFLRDAIQKTIEEIQLAKNNTPRVPIKGGTRKQSVKKRRTKKRSVKKRRTKKRSVKKRRTKKRSARKRSARKRSVIKRR